MRRRSDNFRTGVRYRDKYLNWYIVQQTSNTVPVGLRPQEHETICNSKNTDNGMETIINYQGIITTLFCDTSAQLGVLHTSISSTS